MTAEKPEIVGDVSEPRLPTKSEPQRPKRRRRRRGKNVNAEYKKAVPGESRAGVDDSHMAMMERILGEYRETDGDWFDVVNREPLRDFSGTNTPEGRSIGVPSTEQMSPRHMDSQGVPPAETRLESFLAEMDVAAVLSFEDKPLPPTM